MHMQLIEKFSKRQAIQSLQSSFVDNVSRFLYHNAWGNKGKYNTGACTIDSTVLT